MAIAVARFTPQGDPSRFRQYLKIKYDVFVIEQGWALNVAADDTCAPDMYDSSSAFIVASDGGAVVGAIRATVTSEAFPHRRLFTRHLTTGPISHIPAKQIAVLTALAVRPRFRGIAVDISGEVGRSTVARRILFEILWWLAEKGVVLVMTSATPGPAVRVLESAGMTVLDPAEPLATSGRWIINMACVLCAQDVGTSEATTTRAALLKYLHESHLKITDGRSAGAYSDLIASRPV